MLVYGFKCSNCDTSMFTLKFRGHLIILLLYVDDVVLTGSSTELVTVISLRTLQEGGGEL